MRRAALRFATNATPSDYDPSIDRRRLLPTPPLAPVGPRGVDALAARLAAVADGAADSVVRRRGGFETNDRVSIGARDGHADPAARRPARRSRAATSCISAATAIREDLRVSRGDRDGDRERNDPRFHETRDERRDARRDRRGGRKIRSASATRGGSVAVAARDGRRAFFSVDEPEPASDEPRPEPEPRGAESLLSCSNATVVHGSVDDDSFANEVGTNKTEMCSSEWDDDDPYRDRSPPRPRILRHSCRRGSSPRRWRWRRGGSCSAPGARSRCCTAGRASNRSWSSWRPRADGRRSTPGRLLTCAADEGYVSLEEVKTLILDEADQMVDMGFAPQVAEICRGEVTAASPPPRLSCLRTRRSPEAPRDFRVGRQTLGSAPPSPPCAGWRWTSAVGGPGSGAPPPARASRSAASGAPSPESSRAWCSARATCGRKSSPCSQRRRAGWRRRKRATEIAAVNVAASDDRVLVFCAGKSTAKSGSRRADEATGRRHVDGARARRARAPHVRRRGAARGLLARRAVARARDLRQRRLPRARRGGRG